MFEEKPMVHFCLAMDNYFTLLKIINRLRESGIGVVDTAIFRQNWPPKELIEVEQGKCASYDFYWVVDEFGTLLLTGWTMVSCFVF